MSHSVCHSVGAPGSGGFLRGATVLPLSVHEGAVHQDRQPTHRQDHVEKLQGDPAEQRAPTKSISGCRCPYTEVLYMSTARLHTARTGTMLSRCRRILQCTAHQQVHHHATIHHNRQPTNHQDHASKLQEDPVYTAQNQILPLHIVPPTHTPPGLQVGPAPLSTHDPHPKLWCMQSPGHFVVTPKRQRGSGGPIDFNSIVQTNANAVGSAERMHRLKWR